MNLPTNDIDALFSEWDREGSPGCALGIFRAGEILYKRGYGLAELEHGASIDSSTVFDIASTSKQFTAACVLLLARERKLDLEDDIRKYIPSLPTFKREIKVRHLVHHTSGIRDYTNLFHLAGRPTTNDYSEEEVVDLIARQRSLEFPTGSRYGYSNSGYFLMGEIVRIVAGQSLREFAHDRIFGPLGMSSTFFHDDFSEVVPNRAMGYSPKPDGDGYRISVSIWDVLGDGAVFTNVEDLSIWDRQFYECELPGGQNFIEQLITPGNLDKKVGSKTNYAFGLMVGDFQGERTISHGGSWGGYRSDILRFPDKGLTFVVLANLSTIGAMDLAAKTAEVALWDELKKPSPMSIDLDPPVSPDLEVDIHDWIGLYRDKKAEVIAGIVVDKSGPTLNAFGQSFKLQTVGVNRLRVEGLPVEVELPEKERMIVKIGMQKPVRLSRVEEPLPSQEDLESLVGRYYSRELDATCTIEMVKGSLKLRRGWMPFEDLTPAGGDLFSGGPAAIEFQRRKGMPRGFRLHMNRVGSISFLRQREKV